MDRYEEALRRTEETKRVFSEVCIVCGEAHPAHECPYLPEKRRAFIYDIAEFDDLLQILFERINRRLGGPALILEVHRVPRAWYDFDAYAGVPGKVILTINTSKSYRIEADKIAAAFIHDILHHVYPEYSEERINEVVLEKWKELYGDKPCPFREALIYFG